MTTDRKKAKPNILLIMSDEHAAEFTGAYGHSIVRTPTINRLASDGIVFDNAYCVSPLCGPARMAFMTGRYPNRDGFWDNGVPMRSDVVTWAHRLGHAGYATALSGKMHFIGPDQHHGFDEVLARDDAVCAKNIEVDFRWTDDIVPRPNARARFDQAGAGGGEHIDHDLEVTRTCLEYIDRQAAAQVADRDAKPFVLCAGYNSPHFPLIAPADCFAKYHPDNVDLPVGWDRPIPDLGPHQQRVRRLFGLEGITEEQTLRARAAYFGLITWMDQQIGQLLAKLENTGLSENTVVIYTADHGEMAGTHGMWWKSNFHEQAVRVPLVIRMPGGKQAGSRRAELVSHLDLTTTLLDLGGVAGPATADMENAPLDGNSLLTLLQSASHNTIPWSAHVFSEYYAQASRGPMRMVRQGDHKLNIYHGEFTEMFDLSQDPYEMRNLATEAKHQERRRELTALIYQDWPADEIAAKVRRSQNERWVINGGNRREYRH